MKVKNKLWLGFGFLFGVVLVFGAVAIYYTYQIANNAKVVLKDNYASLNYCRQMCEVMDEQDLPLNTVAASVFSGWLYKEEHNITEKGEVEEVKALKASFVVMQNRLATQPDLQMAEKQARRCLRAIELINMRAIEHKSDMANTSVNDSAIFLGLAGTFTFLVLFTFSVNFPAVIVNPLNTLLMGIRSIGEKNYSKRMNFNSNDEFGELANAFNTMAEQLNDWENSNLSKIMSQKLRIETIIEQMHDAIIGVNEHREILFINTAAKNMFGLEGDHMEGTLATTIAQRNELFRSVTQEGKSGKAFNLMVDGREAHFLLEIRDITVPNLALNDARVVPTTKKSAGMVYMLRNITEFKERDEAKTNFIATISHELKTPISSIKMSLKLMTDERIGSMNAEQQELLGHIKDDSDRLLKITSELLQLSQVETGNIQLNFVPVRPDQLTDYAIRSVSFQAGQKDVKLEVIKEDNLPMINADVEKTAWVLVNLLSNALRYSPERSSVIIRIANKTNTVRFSVQDFGKGIDEQYRQRLFDRYFQVPADDLNKAGSGLGLAISKDFIEAQNGRIWVDSVVGKGSVFSFSLPVQEV